MSSRDVHGTATIWEARHGRPRVLAVCVSVAVACALAAPTAACAHDASPPAWLTIVGVAEAAGAPMAPAPSASLASTHAPASSRAARSALAAYVGHWRSRAFAAAELQPPTPAIRAPLSGLHAGIRSGSRWALSLWLRNPARASYAVIDVQPHDALGLLARAEPRSIDAALCGEF